MSQGLLNVLLASALVAGLLTASAAAAGRFRRRQSGWTSRWRRVAARPVSWRYALVMAGTGAWGFVLLNAAAQAGWIRPLGETPDVGLPALAAQTILLPLGVLASLALCMQIEGASARSAFGLRARQWRCGARQAPLLYLAAIPPLILMAVAWRVALEWLGVPLTPQPLVELLQSGQLPLTAVLFIAAAAITVAPVTEEIFFRGLLLPLLTRHYGPAQAVTAVSLMFACVHFNAASLAPLFVIAAAFALGYLWTGSLLTPILMHALFNGVNLALLMAGVGGG